MTIDGVDDLLNDLKTALDVEPSKALVAGVRLRVEGARLPRPWMLQWRTVAAVAIVTLVAGGVALLHRPVRGGQEVLASVVPNVSPAAPVAVAPVPVVPATRSVSVPDRDSDVLIPPGEMVAMRALLRAIERGEFAVPQETAQEWDSEGRVKPLEIPLIVIEPVTTPKIGEEKGIGS